MAYVRGSVFRKASFNLSICVECGVCTRGICPVNAIEAVPLLHPRTIRAISDPRIRKLTGIPGREQKKRRQMMLQEDSNAEK